METIKVPLSDPTIKQIVAQCYPAYKGRRPVRIDVRETHRVWDFWDGGSRDYTVFYDLGTGRVAPSSAIKAVEGMTQKQGNWFNLPISDGPVTIPPGVIVVIHSIFCGKDVGIRIIVRPENAPRLIPASLSA